MGDCWQCCLWHRTHLSWEMRLAVWSRMGSTHNWLLRLKWTSSMYSALPDVYGQLHLISNTQNISLKSWWVGKIIEHGFKTMIITK
jgi:hypothetical protein